MCAKASGGSGSQAFLQYRSASGQPPVVLLVAKNSRGLHMWQYLHRDFNLASMISWLSVR